VCAIHDALLASPRRLKESIRAKALACLGQIWVEEIGICTQRPTTGEGYIPSADVLSEIADVIDGLRSDSTGLATLLAEGDLAFLSRHLPAELVEPSYASLEPAGRSTVNVTDPIWAVKLLDRVQALLCELSKAQRDGP
jgi:hypothetical protein